MKNNAEEELEEELIIEFLLLMHCGVY